MGISKLTNILYKLVEQETPTPPPTVRQNSGSYDSAGAWDKDGDLVRNNKRVPGVTIGVEVNSERPEVPEVDITGGVVKYVPTSTNNPEIPDRESDPPSNPDTDEEYEPPFITNCVSPDQVLPPRNPILSECKRIKDVMGIKEEIITEQSSGTWSLPPGCGTISSPGCPPCSAGQPTPPISAYPDPCEDPFNIPIFNGNPGSSGSGYLTFLMNDNGLDSFYNIFTSGISGYQFPGNIPSNPTNFTTNLLQWFMTQIPWMPMPNPNVTSLGTTPPYSSITDLLQNHPWFQQYFPNGLVQPGGPGGPCNMSLPAGSGSAGPITYTLSTTPQGTPILIAGHLGGGCFASYLTCMTFTPNNPPTGGPLTDDPTLTHINPRDPILPHFPTGNIPPHIPTAHITPR